MLSFLSHNCCVFLPKLLCMCSQYKSIPDDICKPPHDELPFSLESIQYANTQLHVSPITEGKVIRVNEVDTIIIATRINIYSPDMFRFNVHLRGIQTPEIKNTRACDDINVLVYNKIVQLRNVSLEKHGKLNADVYVDNIHLNQWLIDKQYAVKKNDDSKE